MQGIAAVARRQCICTHTASASSPSPINHRPSPHGEVELDGSQQVPGAGGDVKVVGYCLSKEQSARLAQPILEHPVKGACGGHSACPQPHRIQHKCGGQHCSGSGKGWQLQVARQGLAERTENSGGCGRAGRQSCRSPTGQPGSAVPCAAPPFAEPAQWCTACHRVFCRYPGATDSG